MSRGRRWRLGVLAALSVSAIALPATAGAVRPMVSLPLGELASLAAGSALPVAFGGDDARTAAAHVERADSPLVGPGPLQGNRLVYATYLGDTPWEIANAIAVDSAGNAYVAGVGNGIPVTPGAFDTTLNGDYDAWVAKIDPTGSSVVWATFLGGIDYEEALAVAVNDAGEVYVAGITYSPDFPTTPTSFDPTPDVESDGFLVRLSADGSTLLYGSFFGWSGDESANGIVLDAAGNAYVTGSTSSPEFPGTPGAFDETYNGGCDPLYTWLCGDAFVAKVNDTGMGLVWATFLGGALERDRGADLALGPSGEVFVTGDTRSGDFPTTANALDRTLNGTRDGILAVLSPDGSSLTYGQFLGGNGTDIPWAIRTAGGAAVVAGMTDAADFPTTPDAFDPSYNGGTDGFLVAIDTTSPSLRWGTFMGGQGNETIYGLALDLGDQPTMIGHTDSPDFPTTSGAFDMTYNEGCGTGTCGDAFLARLEATGRLLVYGTYLGGTYGVLSQRTGVDSGYGVAVDASGAAYLAGSTRSVDFPVTPGAIDTVFGWDTDAFIAKLELTSHKIRVDSNPAGVLTLLVDGSPVQAPHEFYCGDGSAPVLTAPSPQTVGGTRYTFSSWSDGGAQSHAVPCTGPGSFVADFTRQHALTFTTTPPGLNVSVEGNTVTTPYTHWCAEGSLVVLDVPSPQGRANTRYTFSDWSDGGAQAHTVACIGPASLMATFFVEFRIVFDTVPTGLTLVFDGTSIVTPTVFWWANGTSHAVTAPTPVGVSPDARYVFLRWSDGPTTPTRVFSTQAPGTYVAIYGEEYQVILETVPTGLQLEVDANTVTAPYASWCPPGDTHAIYAPSPQTLGGNNYSFDRWSDGGAQSHSITCSAPATITASFLQTYVITVDTSPPGYLVYVDGIERATPYATSCPAGGAVTVGPVADQTTTDTRVTFGSWSDGGAATHAVACTGDRRVTAFLDTSYRVRFLTNHNGVQILYDGSPLVIGVDVWCAAGTTHTLDVVSPQPFGSSRYVFAGWQDGGPTARTFPCDGPQAFGANFDVEHLVTADTSPPGLALTVDGSPVTAPHAFWCTEGSSFEVGATSPQGTSDTRFTFASWSDLGAQTHTVACAGPATLTTGFTTAYLVAIDASLPGIEVTVDGSTAPVPRSFWWDAGSSHVIDVASPQPGGPGVRYAFDAWSDGGAQAHAMTANVPGTLRVTLRTQYALALSSDHGAPRCDAPDCWYDAGDAAAISVERLVRESLETQYRFRAWTGDVAGTDPNATVAMTAPKAARAEWTTQYYVRVDSPYGTAAGTGWYDAGMTITISVSPAEVAAGGRTYRFAGWSGATTASDPTTMIRVDGPKTASAMWREVPVETGPTEAPWLLLLLLLGLGLAGAIILGGVWLLRSRQKRK